MECSSVSRIPPEVQVGALEVCVDKSEKTVSGFTVCRRCDSCGTKVVVERDEGDKCLLKCVVCGKEYVFYHRR
jgi:hypothetical protein